MNRRTPSVVSKLAVSLFVSLFACGCAAITGPGGLLDPGPVIEDPGPAERALHAELERANTDLSQPPEALQSALLGPLPGGELAPPDDTTRFDVGVNRADAAQFFINLVEGTPHNVVVHPDVQGTISLQLKNVTIDEVFETVRELYGYGYRRTAGIVHVTPPRMRTEIFHLNYLNVQRVGRSRTRVSSGQVSEQSGSSGSKGAKDGAPKQSGGSVSGSVIATDSKTDLWQEITAVIRHIVGDEAGDRVVASPNSGTFAVRAMPAQLRDVTAYLRTAESSLQRQVTLEAKVVEVTLSDGFRSGINWARLGTLGHETTLVTGQTGGGSSLASEMLSEIAGNFGDLDSRFGLPPAGTITSAFGGVFTAAIEGNDFQAFIELLETQGETQVLSSPRVSTLNNQKAVIKVGSDEFFVTDISTTTVTGTSTTTTPEVTLTPFFSGIALDVTPQIDAEGYITLHIHPSVSEVVDQTKTISLGTDSITLPLAFSTIRETDSVVRAKSSQVIVIGGLMQEIADDRRASTPFLSKIPLLSSLFEHNGETTLKKELVILLRPVADDPAMWRDSIEKSVDRISEMKSRHRLSGKP